MSSSSDTSEKPNHFVASKRRWLESHGRDGARQENGQNEWYDLEYQGAKAVAPPCASNTLQIALLKQTSSSARDEVYQMGRVGSQVKGRRRIAFENLVKGMRRYLDNSNDVKVGITELQARVQLPLQLEISIQQVAQQAMNENDQKIFEIFWQEEELRMASWARWDAQRKGFVDVERRCTT